MTTAEIDPFLENGEKSPAISFKGAAIGTVITVKVTDSPKKIQGKEFGTDNPAVWRNKNGTTSPKYSAVINGTVDGEPRSIWATIPSDLFAKLKAAQQEIGRSVRDGDTVAIKLIAEEPTSGSPKKVYAVKITPGVPAVAKADDPFSSSSTGGWSDEPPF